MRQKRLFFISSAAYLLSSSSVIFMKFGDMSGKTGSVAAAVVLAVLFWVSLIIAVLAQLLLRWHQKPFRQKQSLPAMALSPPTIYFEAGFLFFMTSIIVLSACGINGFFSYTLLFLMLFSFEMSVLSMGKFEKIHGKTVLIIFTRKHSKRGNEK